MRLFKSNNDIDAFVNHKKTIEQDLACELLDEFNNGDLLKTIRTVAYRALEAIMDAPEVLRSAAVRQEDKLTIWNRGPLDVICDEWESLSAEDCSDLIRLYGCLVEQVKDKVKDKEIITSLRPGTEAWSKAEALEAEDKQKDLSRPGRDRYPIGKKNVHTSVFDKTKFRLRDNKGLPPPKWLESLIGAAAFRGIEGNVALDEGVLGKIENTFGLWKGADISGTTADTIYALRRFGRAALDPVFFLLPVATIVWNYHHSLLEVAMVLTMNRIMNYSIGLYSTLMPHNSVHPAKDSISSIFQRFEHRKDNKLILIYHDRNGNRLGCFEFGPEEREGFKRLAMADISLWQQFTAVDKYTSEADVLKMIRRHGLEGKAMLAARHQIRG